jgi:integrase
MPEAQFPERLRLGRSVNRGDSFLWDATSPNTRCVSTCLPCGGRWFGVSLLPTRIARIQDNGHEQRPRSHPTYRSRVRTLLNAARGDRFEALYVLAITTGLRRGELLGLRWQDVDLKRGYLQVRQQPLTYSLSTVINQSTQTHLFTGTAARRATPSRGGRAKPKGLPMKIARLPNRVAVLPKRHPTGRR